METVVRSETKTVVIGPNRPFVIIGERINPSGRKKLAAEMSVGNFERVKQDALAQVQAGAQILDVNAGLGVSNPEEVEPKVMVEAIRAVQEVVDVPISIDSSVIPALKAGLEVAKGKPIVNSVTGEEERLEAILPLVAERGAVVIGLCNDERGILYDPRERFLIAKKIVERAASYGIPPEDILIDPLTLPAGAVPGAGKQVFEIVRMVQEELGVNTVLGASNISFGLPGRPLVNATFLAMAMASGLTSAITNPLDENVRYAILAADMLLGKDENCSRWITAMRQKEGGGSEERRARRRRSRRRS
ncbi:MAG: dihydropteroate synthase [Chloroflexi bacterium]|nr:dihydropteroate synthase [Chloroflexota bacterium]